MHSENKIMNTQTNLPASDDATCYVSSCRRVTLYLGDCLEIAPTLQGVDALISDPPYGIDYNPQYLRTTGHSLNGGNPKNREYPKIEGDKKPFDPVPWAKYQKVAMWGANHYSKRLPDGGRWLVWDKRLDNRIRMDQGDGEVAWTNAKGIALRIYRFWWSGGLMQGEANGKPRLHPTQKPVELMGWALKEAGVVETDTVLDPYMGSGSTIIAAIRQGCRVIGIEKDPTYYATALERIKNELAQGDLFLGRNV
jgi:DNA modification methylase